MDGKCLSNSEALYWRNHLVITLVWNNAPCAGEIINVKVQDYNSCKETDGIIAIRVRSCKSWCNHMYSMQLY